MRICVSGAGIAGLALAYWPLHHGHQPTLVEIAPHFRRGGYIIDFRGKGYELAGRMGVLPRGEPASILYDSVKDRVETLFDTSITSLTDLGHVLLTI